MAAMFPKLVAEIDRLLRLDDSHHPLIGTVGALQFHGICNCSATCDNPIDRAGRLVGAIPAPTRAGRH
jgi:hypothetical protein